MRAERQQPAANLDRLSRYYTATPTTISEVFSFIAGNISKLRQTE